MNGRMGRPRYALGVVLSWIAAFIAFLVAFIMGWGFDAPQESLMVWVISWALIALASLPLHVRRLHDVDLSGWWLLVPAALMGVLFFTAGVLPLPFGLNIFTPEALAVAFYGLTCAAGFVWPGQQGSNRYGAAVRHATWVNVASAVGATGLLILLALATITFFR